MSYYSKSFFIILIAFTINATAFADKYSKVYSISEFINLPDGEISELYLADNKNARVIFSTPDESFIYVRDNTAAISFHGIHPTRFMTNGQHIAGWIKGKKLTENGIPIFEAIKDITNTYNLIIADQVTEPNLQPLKIIDNKLNKHINDWITISDTKVIGNKEKWFINNDIEVDKNFDKTIDLYNNANIDITGVLVKNGIKTLIMPFTNNTVHNIIFVLSADKDFTPPKTNLNNVSVRLNRTFVAGKYTTLCLPFSTTFDGDIWSIDKIVNGEAIFKKSNIILASQPYIVCPNNNIDNKLYNNVSLSYNTPILKGENDCGFIGSFSTINLIPNANCTISEDGKIDYQTYKLLTTQACFKFDNNNKINKIIFGKTDNITLPNTNIIKKQIIYNLKGEYVGSDATILPKGIYIINKKKVLIK